MNNSIAICFAINDAYCEQTIKIIKSISINTATDSIRIYILFNNLNTENKARILTTTNIDKRLDIKFVEISKNIFKDVKITIHHTSIETYFRLLIPSLFKGIENKILYLDADIVIRKSIDQLWNTDVENYCIAGAEDIFINNINHKKNISLTDNDIYVNAGVLLFNIKKINKIFQNNDLILAAIKFKNLTFQDQDLLNILFKGNIKQIERKYNMTMADIKKSTLEKIEAATIIHYTGSNKPWNTKNTDAIPYKYYFTDNNNRTFFHIKKEDYNGYRHYSLFNLPLWHKKLK